MAGYRQTLPGCSTWVLPLQCLFPIDHHSPNPTHQNVKGGDLPLVYKNAGKDRLKWWLCPITDRQRFSYRQCHENHRLLDLLDRLPSQATAIITRQTGLDWRSFAWPFSKSLPTHPNVRSPTFDLHKCWTCQELIRVCKYGVWQSPIKWGTHIQTIGDFLFLHANKKKLGEALSSAQTDMGGFFFLFRKSSRPTIINVQPGLVILHVDGEHRGWQESQTLQS